MRGGGAVVVCTAGGGLDMAGSQRRERLLEMREGVRCEGLREWPVFELNSNLNLIRQ